MVAYSSFTAVSEMTCPGAQGPALKPAVTDDALRRVNWLINTYYNPVAGVNPQCYLPEPVLTGTYQSRTATPAGLTAAATREDVQQAIWTLLGTRLVSKQLQSEVSSEAMGRQHARLAERAWSCSSSSSSCWTNSSSLHGGLQA